MDNLVLVRVAAAMAASLADSILEDARQESEQRFRLVFRGEADRAQAVVISLRPELPWIGRPASRAEGGAWSPGPFSVRLKRELAGLRLVGIEKPGLDRIVALRFSGGRSLLAELATHGANLVLVNRDGNVEDAARHPRGAQERLKAGSPYTGPPLPAGKLVPFGLPSEAIDAFVAARVGEGEAPFEVLRRHVFGVGSLGAALVLSEVSAVGLTAGQVLAARLQDLHDGRVEPVIEAPEDPREAAEKGRLDPERFRLWPWPPREIGPGHSLLRRADAAATAGLYHEALERGAWVELRAEALRGVLRRELRRTTEAERGARGDVEGFEDPERWRLRGEALLAGLSVARRAGGYVSVPDPYDPEGGEISFPAPPAMTATQVAEDCFHRYRRAKRGLESARSRAADLRARRERLEALEADGQGRVENASAEERRLAAALRREGVAVGLAAGTRAQRQSRAAVLPHPEGVRLLTSRDGLTILVGRTGRDNDRLTFKLAGPEDFWFHADGVPGAHVVVRNPDRAARPPAATIEDAAAAAAWYSEARTEGAVDVRWTRRKNIRRASRGKPGLVVLKRFETIRVKPALPAGEAGAG